MTEREELERKILLQQQALTMVKEARKEWHREQIRLMRRRLWEIKDGKCLNLCQVA